MSNDERRNHNEQDHDRIIRVEVKQDLLHTTFREHEKHDESRFAAINTLLTQITKTQVSLVTSIKMVGVFVTLIVPVITALIIHFTK